MADGSSTGELPDMELPVVQQSYISFVRDTQTRASPVAYAATLEQFPANGSILTYLPPDMIAMVLSYLLEHGYKIDITLRDRKRGRMASFKSWFPGFDQRPIFNVCDELTDHCIEFLFSNNKFYSKNAVSFQDLPRAMGQEWVSHIRHLELKNHFLLVTEYYRGLRQLEFIINKMASLKSFKLTNDFGTAAEAHVSTSGNDRTSQERRALIEMGAFLTLRHPSLTLLIWPGDSGVSLKGRIWLSIELKAKDMRKAPDDRVLNSKAIRRYSWIELHDTPLDTFFLSNDAETSEGPEPDLFLEEDCNLIDKFGYMTPAAQRQLGHKGPTFALPKMIHTAKVNKTQRVREERDEEARKRRDQMDLQRMADLTIERRGNNSNAGRGTHGFGYGSRRGSRGGGGAFHTTQASSPTTNNQQSVTAPAVSQHARGGLFGNGRLFGQEGAAPLSIGTSPAVNPALISNPVNSLPFSPSNVQRDMKTSARGVNVNAEGGHGLGATGNWRGISISTASGYKQHGTSNAAQGSNAQDIGHVNETDWPTLGSGPPRRRRR